MNGIRIRVASLGLGILLIFLLVGVVRARSSANYAIDWEALSGGGTPAETTDGNVTLNSSLGQTVIGPSTSTSYNLGAGYWHSTVLPSTPSEQKVYLPIILRSA